MFKKIMDFNTIILMSLSIIVHFFRIIYLLFKPRFMSKYEFFANYTVSKSQLSVYYLLCILVSYWIILKKIQKLRIYYYAFLSDCYSFNSFFTQMQLLDKSYQKKIKCIKRSYFYFNIHISSMYLSTICKQEINMGYKAAFYFAVIPQMLFYQSQLNLQDCQLTLFVDFP